MFDEEGRDDKTDFTRHGVMNVYDKKIVLEVASSITSV